MDNGIFVFGEKSILPKGSKLERYSEKVFMANMEKLILENSTEKEELKMDKNTINLYIKDEKYYIMDETITVCIIVDIYGFKHKGESFCANIDDFDKALGEKYAKEKAIEAMLPYYIFLNKYLGYIKFNYDIHHNFHIALGKVLTGNYTASMDIWKSDCYIALINNEVVVVDGNGDKKPYGITGKGITATKWKVKPYNRPFEKIKVKPVKFSSETNKVLYTFSDALEKVMTGNYCIRLDTWDEGNVAVLNDGKLMLKFIDCEDKVIYSSFHISSYNIIGDKWTVEPIESNIAPEPMNIVYYKFHEAITKVITGEYSIRFNKWHNIYSCVLVDGLIKMRYKNGNGDYCYTDFTVNSAELNERNWTIEKLSIDESKEVETKKYYKFYEAIAKVATGGYNMKLDDWGNYHVTMKDNLLVMQPDNLSGNISTWNPLSGNNKSHMARTDWIVEEKKKPTNK